jgi:hypothetical protein
MLARQGNKQFKGGAAMIASFADWLGVASAALAGVLAAGGVGVAALRFFGANLIGHWLAKALARYTAEIETVEQRKRSARARIDQERAETINRVMSRLAHALTLMLYPPQPDNDDEKPEILFLNRYREIERSANRITRAAIRSGHKFQKSEPLLPACMACAREIHVAAGAFYDSLQLPDTHWNLSRQDRIAVLVQLHKGIAKSESTAQQHLIEICREMYVNAAGG